MFSNLQTAHRHGGGLPDVARGADGVAARGRDGDHGGAARLAPGASGRGHASPDPGRERAGPRARRDSRIAPATGSWSIAHDAGHAGALRHRRHAAERRRRAARRAFEASLTEVFGSAGDARVRYDGKTDPQIARELMRGAGTTTRRSTRGSRGDPRLPRAAQKRGRRRRAALRAAPWRGRAARCARAARGRGARLLTGNVAEGAAVKLAAAGLDIGRFRVNAFGSDHEHRPELPRVAQRRARALLGHDFVGEAIVIVGDTPADIHCARSVGARTVAVASGRYAMAELAEHAPTHLFADLTDTDAVVAALLEHRNPSGSDDA
jgi:phosphoglycolate phosphatase-like HAD superfamily hydrolase